MHVSPLETQFEDSFHRICLEELVHFLEKECEALEVRGRGQGVWEARLWIEEFPGTTWPLVLYRGQAGTATCALLEAWRQTPRSQKGFLNGAQAAGEKAI